MNTNEGAEFYTEFGPSVEQRHLTRVHSMYPSNLFSFKFMDSFVFLHIYVGYTNTHAFKILIEYLH